MIFKCSDAYVEKPLIINKNLLNRYKAEGDDYLVSIHSQLSRSLVDYKLFQELQKVNNNYYVIVDGLQCERYTQIKSLTDDKGKLLNSINIDGIKIHMLHILKGTPLAEYYNKNKFHILSKSEYIDIVITEFRQWKNHPFKVNLSIEIMHILLCLDRKEDAKEFYLFFKRLTIE